ncbi:hypothetical protein [Streptomyces sp. TS71-3]|uniref:hypothetical protein n=1 Tax=Streptomyces sp. TS71-3 TaxID=2733862 RepID=UPI001BB394AE|nr:hypothetical protein [Streptomyces sp. TS71-3]
MPEGSGLLRDAGEAAEELEEAEGEGAAEEADGEGDAEDAEAEEGEAEGVEPAEGEDDVGSTFSSVPGLVPSMP